MRFTSLIVELIRARPRLIFWTVALLQAALWLILPLLLYASPPGDLAKVLAFGREYRLGTELGPPLAFWLADIAFRAAGGHMFGVYLLVQVCFVTTLWAVFTLARAIVGGPQAMLAALLTATLPVFSFPDLEFGPAVLACPLWALALLQAWRIMGQGRRGAWLTLAVAIGLLFLTTPAAIVLLALLAGFALATQEGRRTLRTLDPVFAALIAAALSLPYLIWLAQNAALPSWPLPDEALARLRQWGGLLGTLALSLLAIAVLALVNWRGLSRQADDAPQIFRPPTGGFARSFVYAFALAPPLVLSLTGALFGLDHVAAGEGAALLLAGLAVIVAAGDLIPLRRIEALRTVWLIAILVPVLVVLSATFLQPWTSAREVKTLLPTSQMGRFFADTYRLRVGQELRAVAGDPELAMLVGLGAPSRPHVLFDAAPQRTPWLTPEQFRADGGIVLWRASDTVGAPPKDLAERFPGLVPEVPRAFKRLVTGRQEALLVGWGLMRPATQGSPPQGSPSPNAMPDTPSQAAPSQATQK